MTSNLGDPRFFARSGPHPLSSIAAAAGCTSPDEDFVVHGIAPLQSAQPDQISFLDNRRYLRLLKRTQAGALVVHPDMGLHVPDGTVPIFTGAVCEAWVRVAALFHPPPPLNAGVSALACIDRTASVHPTAAVGSFAMIGARVEVGPRCQIGVGAVIGDGVIVGADCRIGAQASISHACLGARVYVYPGARIGQEGFSFGTTAEGFLSMPHLGKVVIQDDVEIGANTTIDRGSMQDTVIGVGTRIDNLVQIGHNVRIGRYCVIVAQVGISGSTTLGDFVQVGGQAAMAGHLTIGAGTQIGAQAGVIGDVPPGSRLLGSPAQPAGCFLRQVATLKRLAKGTRPTS